MWKRAYILLGMVVWLGAGCSSASQVADSPSKAEFFAAEPALDDRDVLVDCDVKTYDRGIAEVQCRDVVISTQTRQAADLSESQWWNEVAAGLRERFSGRFSAYSEITEIDGNQEPIRHFVVDDAQGTTRHNGLFFIERKKEANPEFALLCFHPESTVDIAVCRRAIEQVLVGGFPGVDNGDEAEAMTLAGVPVEYGSDCRARPTHDSITCGMGEDNHQMSWYVGNTEEARLNFEQSLERIRRTPTAKADRELGTENVDCEIIGHRTEECRRGTVEVPGDTVVFYVALAEIDWRRAMVLCSFQNAPVDDLPSLCEQVLSVE